MLHCPHTERKYPQLADATLQGLASGGLNVAEQPGGSAASGSTLTWRCTATPHMSIGDLMRRLSA
jgi:hypothetical protein